MPDWGQTNTAADNSGLKCNSTALASGPDYLECAIGSPTGSSEVQATISGNGTQTAFFFESNAGVGQETWPTGDWVININFSTVVAKCYVSAIYVCRIQAGGTSVGTVCSATGLSDVLSSTYQRTITQTVQSERSGGSTDHWYIQVVLFNDNHAASAIGVTPNKTITTPSLTATYNETADMGGSVYGVAQSNTAGFVAASAIGTAHDFTGTNIADMGAAAAAASTHGLAAQGGGVFDDATAVGSSFNAAAVGSLSFNESTTLASAHALAPGSVLQASGVVPIGLAAGLVSGSQALIDGNLALALYAGVDSSSTAGFDASLSVGSILDFAAAGGAMFEDFASFAADFGLAAESGMSVFDTAVVGAGFVLAGTAQLDASGPVTAGVSLGLADSSGLVALEAAAVGVSAGLNDSAQLDAANSISVGLSAGASTLSGLIAEAQSDLGADLAVIAAGGMSVFDSASIGWLFGVVSEGEAGEAPVLTSYRIGWDRRHMWGQTNKWRHRRVETQGAPVEEMLILSASPAHETLPVDASDAEQDAFAVELEETVKTSHPTVVTLLLLLAMLALVVFGGWWGCRQYRSSGYVPVGVESSAEPGGTR